MVIKEAEKVSLAKSFWKYHLVDEYKQVYDQIKAVDSNMREKLHSKDPAIGELLHLAKLGMRDREYAKVIYYTWQLIGSLNDIFEQVPYLNVLKEEMRKKYYEEHGGLTEDQLKELRSGIKPIKSASAPRHLLYVKTAPDFDLVSEAGIINWISENRPTMKGMRGAFLEKVFRNEILQQKNLALKAISLAESTYRSIKIMLKKLKEYDDDLAGYTDTCNSFKKVFDTNKLELIKIYQNPVFADLIGKEPEQDDKTPIEVSSDPQVIQTAPSNITAPEVPQSENPATNPEENQNIENKNANDLVQELYLLQLARRISTCD
jgi:hypothetical protein